MVGPRHLEASRKVVERVGQRQPLVLVDRTAFSFPFVTALARPAAVVAVAMLLQDSAEAWEGAQALGEVVDLEPLMWQQQEAAAAAALHLGMAALAEQMPEQETPLPVDMVVAVVAARLMGPAAMAFRALSGSENYIDLWKTNAVNSSVKLTVWIR
jgi:hypothetical protein